MVLNLFSPHGDNHAQFAKSLYDFCLWREQEFSYNLQFVTSSDDFLMEPLSDKTIVFNLGLLKKVNPEFMKLVLVHEMFHLIHHKIPSKRDVRMLKEIPGLMQDVDIEADLVTAQFFHQAYGWSLEKYLRVYFSGVGIFNASFKREKFDRFVSSILSSFRMMTGKISSKVKVYTRLYDGSQEYVFLIITSAIDFEVRHLFVPNHVHKYLMRAYTGNIQVKDHDSTMVEMLKELNQIINPNT